MNEIIKKHIDFNLNSAQFFLDQISSEVPLEIDPEERNNAERNSQCFLFFALSSIDSVYGIVNEQLNLEIPIHQVSVKNLVESLSANTDEQSKQLLLEIQNNIQEPIHSESQTTKDIAIEYSERELGGSLGLDYFSIFENRNGVHFKHSWDRKKSFLWELRQLRNQITHGPVFKTGGERGTVPARDAIIIHLKYGSRKHHEMAFIFNPHEYFSHSLNLISNHIHKILSILYDS